MKTDYGTIVKKYTCYTSNPEDAEARLGRMPALAHVKGKVIVDLGCGPATCGKLLSDAGATVIGLDISPKVIEEARQVDPKGDYRVYRGLLAEKLRGAEIDCILMSFSFCVIPDREIRYMLRDIRRIISGAARLVIIEPNQERAHGIKYRNVHYHRKKGVQTGDYVHVTLGTGEGAIQLYDDIYRTHADYQELLEEAGFVIETMTEPRPEDDWGKEWEMERKYPPFLLITAR